MSLTKITNSVVADDAIDSEHYAAGSIDEDHIADNAVTLAKMAGGTDGNIISYDASGNPVAIATGNDGQVLTSAGAGSPPAFEDAAGGGGSAVISKATPSLASTVDFTGFSSGTYCAYTAYYNLRPTDDGTDFSLLVSTNGGSSYDGNNNYVWNSSGYRGASSTELDGSTGGDRFELTGNNIGSSGGERVSGWVNIVSPDIEDYTYVTWQSAAMNDATTGYFMSGGGHHKVQSAVDAIRFRFESGTIVGTILFIGHKNS